MASRRPLRRSPFLAYFRRAEARFVWHQLTGAVSEMSAGVLAQLLSFGLQGRDPGPEDTFADGLAGIGALVPANRTPEQELEALDAWHVVRFRWAVWEEGPERITLWFPDGSHRSLHGVEAEVWRSAAQEPRLEALVARWGDAARQAVFALTSVATGALKLAPRLAPPPPGLHSSMPFERFHPELPEDAHAPPRAHDARDLAGYHDAVIADADQQFDDLETTLSHLFRDPHPALAGRTLGHALVDALLEHGVPAPGPAGPFIAEVGGGTGWLARRVLERLTDRGALTATARWIGIDRAPALLAAQRRRLAGLPVPVTQLRADATCLPLEDASVDLLLSNEMAGDLPFGPGEDGTLRALGAEALVGEAARVLRPGGCLFLSEFGAPELAPVRSTHLDHDEHSIRFADLESVAAAAGLVPQLWCLPDLIDLRGTGRDDPALWTTRGSYSALRALLAEHGVRLTKRAWLRSDVKALLAGATPPLRLEQVGGLIFGPLEERTMGLRPREFWALVARKP